MRVRCSEDQRLARQAGVNVLGEFLCNDAVKFLGNDAAVE
jgi:hypothetical protein